MTGEVNGLGRLSKCRTAEGKTVEKDTKEEERWTKKVTQSGRERANCACVCGGGRGGRTSWK